MKNGWTAAACLFGMTAAIGLQGMSSAAAHPHVWVTVRTEVLYDEKDAISGFRHKWTFDEYYSSFAVQGLDGNGDGKYDRAELTELAEINIASLKDFGFFTFPKVSDTILERKPPQDYWLEYDGTNLTLFLTLPLTESVQAEKVKEFTLGVYDPTFYVDFALASETPITLAGAPEGCKPVVADPDPSASQVSVSGLGEAFFDGLGDDGSEAEKYAKKITISCTAG